MDLSVFLIDELDSAVVPTLHQETQADSLHPLPPRQPYVPRKTGVDNETQITADDTKILFDFEKESAALVTLITEKTLEQALAEVNAEAELAAILAGIEDCEKQRESEVEWMKEQEDMMVQAQAKVLAGVADVRHRLSLQRSTKRSIAGLQMIRQILPDIIKSVVEKWPSADHIVTAQDIVPAVIREAAMNVALHEASAVVMEELTTAAGSLFEQSDAIPPHIPFPLSKLTVRFVREVQVMPSAPSIESTAVVQSDEGEANEGEAPAASNEEAAEEPERQPIIELQVVTQLSMPIEAQDSALSLERKVTSFLRQIQLSKQQEAERLAEAAAAGEAPAPDPSSNTNESPLPLTVDIYGPLATIISGLYNDNGLAAAPVARDAQLSFYPLNMESIVIDVKLQVPE